MRQVRIKGFGHCPQCLHRKLTVMTNSPTDNKFIAGEILTCDKCGTEGVIKTDQYGDNFINWAERYNTTREGERVAKELGTLIRQADMVALAFAVQAAHSRSTGEHGQCLRQVQEIINKLTLMKDKGVI